MMRLNPQRWTAHGIVLLLATATMAMAQDPAVYGVVDPLPATVPFAEEVSPYAPLGDDACYAQPAGLLATQPLATTPTERGLLQGIDLSTDWAPRLDQQSLGRSTTSAAVKLGVPLPLTVGAILTPRWAIHLLEGPAQTDLPPRLHELEVGLDTYHPLGPQWMVNTNVTVGLYGDDQSLDSSDAFKVSGHLLGIYTASPTWKWILGAAVVNRTESTLVPVFGVMHDHGPIQYELVFPRPKIRWRLPPTAHTAEHSFYLGGEYTADAWEVERTNLTTDTLSLQRYGLLMGYERQGPSGWKLAYEVGYLFARDLEYRLTGEQIRLKDSLLARIGYTY